MKITTQRDLIENLDLLKQKELVKYAGTWAIYKKDGDCSSPDNTIYLNADLFNVYKDCEYFHMQYYTASHKSVITFKFDVTKNYDIDKLCIELIPLFQNKRFKSMTEVVNYIESKGYKSSINDYHFDFGSYWGGSKYCSCLLIRKDDTQIGIPYNSCGRTQMLKKNIIFKSLVRYHRRLNGYAWLNYDDVKWQPTGYGTMFKNTQVIDDFWKQIPSINPYNDKDLDCLVDKTREIINV